MAILSYEKKDDVPSDLAEHSEEKDGKWIVNVGPKATISEFRENNQKLRDDLDSLKKQLGQAQEILGDDADAFKEELEALRDTKQKVDDGKLQKKDEIEAEITRRVDAVKTALEQKIADRDAKITNLEGSVKDRDDRIMHTKLADYIRGQVTSADAGVEPSAVDYLIADAAKEFEWDGDENTFVRKTNGKVQLGADGYKPQTGAEWIAGLKETRPLFFKKSTGGDAGGRKGDKFGGHSETEFRKLSPQQKLQIANDMQTNG